MELRKRSQAALAANLASRLALKHNLERTKVLMARFHELLGVTHRPCPQVPTTNVIRLPVPVLPSREGHSGGSARRKRLRRASVVHLRLPHRKIPAECVHAGTTSQLVDGVDQGLAPSRFDRPRYGKSGLCLEGLASRELIMDDKSMQPWITEQLTSAHEARRIAQVSAGRPKEPIGPVAYRTAFIKRVRAARALYTDSPPDMAKALGVERDTYYRYEKRLMMPHHLIPRFCEITGVTVQWLLEGPAAARAMNQPHAATGTDHR